MPSLVSLELIHCAVPLKRKIAHASHERVVSDNLIACATLDDGTRGYGEGVPRPYVTGETIEGCFANFEAAEFEDLCGKIESVEGLVFALENSALEFNYTFGGPRGIGANALTCALELAILDAFSRSLGLSFARILRRLPEATPWLRPQPAVVRYSGAITADGERKERISAWKMRLYGFHQVKVKVGVAGQDDARRLRTFRRILGSRVDIRVDANEAWRPAELVDRVSALREARPSLIEQPVSHEDLDSLAELRPKLGLPVMLDESLCGQADADRAISSGLCDYFNVRLSKCGGLLASVRLINMALRAGLKVQLGCHPGETGILSAAGRHVASNLKNLSYVEGSYDRHVLAENVIENDITFRYGGRAAPLVGPGLGVKVSQEKIERLALRRERIDLD